MTKAEAMSALLRFPGVAIKTAACVILFRLRHPCLAVDTHVHRFCCWLGWTPERVDPDTCFNHVDFMVPDHLKYGLHQLFIKHGQECFKCRAATKPGTAAWESATECPLEELLDRGRVHHAGRVRPSREAGGNRVRGKKEDGDESDQEDEDELVEEGTDGECQGERQ